MSTDYHAATDCLLFEVLRICRRVAVAIDARADLHPEELEVIPDHPLNVRLRMNMPLNG